MNQITITEEQSGAVGLYAPKSIKWGTLLVGAELLIEAILDNEKWDFDVDDDIDSVFEEIKRIYLRKE